MNEARIVVSWGDVDDTVPNDRESEMWDGSITLEDGKMEVLRTLWFREEADRVGSLEGESIAFNSDIVSNYDGVYLRMFPTKDQQEVVFETESGIRIAKDLGYFVDNKYYEVDAGDGYKVKFTRQQILTSSGEETHVDPFTGEEITKDTRDIDDSSDTPEREDFEPYDDNESPEEIRLKAFKDRYGFQGDKKDPKLLLILGKEDVERLTKEDLTSFDLRQLKAMPALLKKKLRSIDDSVEMLFSEEAKLDSSLEEGELPEDLLPTGVYTEEKRSRLRNLFKKFTHHERKLLYRYLKALSKASHTELSELSEENMYRVLKLSSIMSEQNVNFLLPTYISQLRRIANLEASYMQIKDFLSDNQQAMADKLFERLRERMLMGTSVNDLLTAIRSYLGEVGGMTFSEKTTELEALHAKLTTLQEASQKQQVETGLMPFKDVSENSWYTSFVHTLSREGAVSGYKDEAGKPLGEFRPGNKVSVAEALKIVLGSVGHQPADSTPELTQAINHWSEGYVRRAEMLGLSIVDDTALFLDRPLTRGELIQMMLEAYGISAPSYASYSFADVNSSTPFADAIEYAYEKDVVSGDDDKGTFRPGDSLNRAEIAKVILQMKAKFGALLE